MKILITGNCGFIGQNLVRLYKEEHDFIGIDKLGYASDINAMKLCPTWKLDLAVDNLDSVFKLKFDAIIHCAAESHVDNSINSPEPFIYSNYIGTFKLLEMARKHKIRFVYISTDEVMGDLNPEDSPFSDPYRIKPSSSYSASKAAADCLVSSYYKTYNMDVVTVRPCNNYGPFQFFEKFIPVVIVNALKNNNIPLYGDGLNMREWIHVKDNCNGIMSTLYRGRAGEIYNLGSGEEITNLELIKIILKCLNKNESLIKFVEDRKGHDRRYFMDSNKSYEVLKWNPKIKLENGIKETIEWYKNKMEQCK